MKIRAVTDADEGAVRELWHAGQAEVPEHEAFEPEEWDEAWADLRRHARDGAALLVEDDAGRAAAYAFATERRGRRSHVTDVYVRPDLRRQGVATQLMRELAEGIRDLGAEWVSLDVKASNGAARTLYERLGFEEVHLMLAAPAETLLADASGADGGFTLGAVYVQTDDQGAIAAAVRRFVPRLYRATATVVSAPRDGWVAIADEVGEGDPTLLRRLAQELSHVTGSVLLLLAAERGRVVRLAAWERGSLLDEYLSLPEAYGPLAPGDAVALRANPTVLSRLTGAEPARIRAVARTATSSDELPAREEHATELAAVLGLAPPASFADAAAQPGAVTVEHD